jgi:hypothetical protein
MVEQKQEQKQPVQHQLKQEKKIQQNKEEDKLNKTKCSIEQTIIKYIRLMSLKYNVF